MTDPSNILPAIVIASVMGGISGSVSGAATADFYKRQLEQHLEKHNSGSNTGLDGKSAYQHWLSQGNLGTIGDFLNSLRGTPGLSVLNGIIDPVPGDGVDGEFFINTTTNEMFGPKDAGVWPTPGFSLVGPAGPQGPPGLDVEVGILNYLDIYMTEIFPVTTFTISNTFLDIPLTDERHVDTVDFTHTTNSPEVTILSDDVYEISWSIGLERASGGNRSDSDSRLMLDSGSGYNEVPGTSSHGYHRSPTIKNSHGRTIILSVVAGSKIKLQARRSNGSSILKLIPGANSLMIRKIKGVQA